MAEKKVEEQTAEQAFDAGFDEDTPVGVPEAKTAEADGEAQPKQETEPKPGEGAAAEEPEYVQLTKADFARLIGSANETDKLKQQMSQVFGTTGNLQQIVKRLQAETPAGFPVEMTLEDFPELSQDFGELAGQTVAGFNRFLKRLKVKGTAEPEEVKPATQTPTVDRESIIKELKQERIKLEIEALNDLHPDWRVIVGQNIVDGKVVLGDDGNAVLDPNSEFRKWLATQPENYQATINSTSSASITSRAIDKFKAAKAAAKPFAQPAPKPKDAARTDRIRENVQPRGTGGAAPGPTTKSAQDHFDEGYASD